MSATVELNATEIATRLLPLLKEYAAKMASFSKEAEDALTKYGSGQYLPGLYTAVRLLCLHETLEKPVTDLAREASGLIEHAALEYHLRGELKLRLDELEEHIKFTLVMVDELRTKIIADYKSEAARLRALLESKGGRYKAPF
jgi:hypothetical protein